MSTAVKNFYNAYGMKEVERLSSIYCTFEYTNNLKLMEKHLPAACRILEIGAGPGQYSLPLLKMGHRVTLYDISEVLLAIASETFEKENVVPEGIICDDARNLAAHPGHDFDAILLMGPMYHILDEADRSILLDNVYGKLKHGGVALVEFINAWGVMRVGIDEFPAEYREPAYLLRYLSPFSINAADEPMNDFTDVHLSTPPAASATLRRAGFDIVSYAGTESFVSGMKAGIENMQKQYPEAFENVVETAFSVCEQHPFRDLTEHMTFIVRKN